MQTTGPKATQRHYAWIIVLAGGLSIFACLGLARFAFGMLLPSMRDALGMTYDQMGFLGTGNFAGYLAGVILAPILLRRVKPRVLIPSGLLLITCCMLGVGAVDSYQAVLVLYALVGVGSGLVNIPVMALVAYWFRREKRGQAAGMMVIGSGVAIMLSGIVIPCLNQRLGADGWRAGWLALALLVLLVTIVAAVLIRNEPGDKGLTPLGRAGEAEYEPVPAGGLSGAARTLLHLGGLYSIFGATYVIYGTFIVTTMVEEHAYAEASAGHFWAWVGFFSLFSGTVFGVLSDRFGRRGGLMTVFAVQTVAYLLAGSGLGGAALFGSVVLYGVAVFAIPAIMAAAVGDCLGKARAATGFSIITFCFAIGQAIGPAAAGVAAEMTGSFTTSYLASAFLTGVAVIWCRTLPGPVRDGCNGSER